MSSLDTKTNITILKLFDNNTLTNTIKEWESSQHHMFKNTLRIRETAIEVRKLF